MFYKETASQETAVGRIPKDWAVKCVNELFQVETGTTPSTTKKVDYWEKGTVNWLTPADMSKSEGAIYISSGERRITEKAVRDCNLTVIPKGSLVLSTRAPVGYVAVLSEESAFNQGCKGLIPRKYEDVCPEFYYYYLLSKKQILNNLSSGSTFKELSKEMLEKVRVVLLKPREQKGIVEVLSCVDLAIQKTAGVIAKTERLKKGLMQKLLTEGIGHKEFKETEVGKIPTTWEVKSLEETCLAIIDCPHTTPKLVKKGFLVIKNFNIHNGELLLEPAFYTTEDEWFVRTKRCVPKKGDVLFSREAPIGEACLAPANIRFSLGQRTMLLRPNGILLNPTYLVHVFYSPHIKRKLRNLEAGVTAHHVNVADIRRLRIPLPPLGEQEQIGSVSDAVDEKLSLERKSKANLERTRQGLMDLLLSGKVRVKVD